MIKILSALSNKCSKYKIVILAKRLILLIDWFIMFPSEQKYIIKAIIIVMNILVNIYMILSPTEPEIIRPVALIVDYLNSILELI